MKETQRSFAKADFGVWKGLFIKSVQLTQIVLLLVVVDQLGKVIIGKIAPEAVSPNRGVAFGLLADRGLEFNLLALAILGVYWLKFWLSLSKKQLWGVGLCVGGGVANLVDRIRFGFVVDWTFLPPIMPAANLADWAIVAGVIILLSHHLNLKIKKPKI